MYIFKVTILYICIILPDPLQPNQIRYMMRFFSANLCLYGYWKFTDDSVIYLPLTDQNVRQANLASMKLPIFGHFLSPFSRTMEDLQDRAIK